MKAGWQRDYFLGRGAGGGEAPVHQTKMVLGAFERSGKG